MAINNKSCDDDQTKIKQRATKNDSESFLSFEQTLRSDKIAERAGERHNHSPALTPSHLRKGSERWPRPFQAQRPSPELKLLDLAEVCDEVANNIEDRMTAG